jgi:translation initiation factor IF-2
LVPEDWGGKTIVSPISAKAGTGIDALLDVLLLVADIEKDRIVANPKRRAIGTVIESHVDPASGVEATVIVQNGTLRGSDTLGVRNLNYGRVRAMLDWKGDAVSEATPSMPVKIVGWKAAPAVGDIMEVPADPKALEKVKVTEVSRGAAEEVAAIKHAPPTEGQEGEARKVLNLIIRADVLGSLEAILGMLDTIRHEDVSVKVIGKGLGYINESDVLNAEATGAYVLGFNAVPNQAAEQLARDKNVTVRHYKIIYKLFEDVLKDLEKLLPSETVLTELGKLEVLAIFRKTDDGMIVGGKVLGGKLIPKARLRVKRGEQYVGEGEIFALQSGKSEAKEVRGGQECGMQYKGRTKLEVGDVLEAYTEEKKSRRLVIEGISKR